MRNFFLALILCGSAVSLHAQTAAIADTWSHLQAVPAHTHMHVSSDVGGTTCYFIAADEQTLTCGHKDGGAKGQRIFQRATVKSVKLTRYGWSTLGGLGIGIGTGALVGVAVFRPTPNDWFGNLGSDIGRAFCIVVGTIAGPIVGGTTDMFRGPVVYRRLDAAKP